MARALTAKQARFVDEYLVDLNATQAAVRAGYSEKTAGQIAGNLLKKVEIQEAAAELMSARRRRTQITQDAVLAELAHLVFFDPRTLFNKDGSPKQIVDLDARAAASLAGVEVLEEFRGLGQDRAFVGYTKKFKFVDKNVAMRHAMLHLGMLKGIGGMGTDEDELPGSIHVEVIDARLRPDGAWTTEPAGADHAP